MYWLKWEKAHFREGFWDWDASDNGEKQGKQVSLKWITKVHQY